MIEWKIVISQNTWNIQKHIEHMQLHRQKCPTQRLQLAKGIKSDWNTGNAYDDIIKDIIKD